MSRTANHTVAREVCDTCDRETRHGVSIEIRAEIEGENADASREPYRITVCRICGTESAVRANKGG